jgi:hypothetical protein
MILIGGINEESYTWDLYVWRRKYVTFYPGEIKCEVGDSSATQPKFITNGCVLWTC